MLRDKGSPGRYIPGKENILIYVILLVAGIVSCVIRYPDFDTTLWSAEYVGYQLSVPDEREGDAGGGRRNTSVPASDHLFGGDGSWTGILVRRF